MPERSSLQVAEIADRHRRHLAWMMLGIGFIHVTRILEGLLPGDAEFYTDGAALAGAVMVVFFGGRIVLWKARNLSADIRDLYLDSDGFVASAILRAHAISWGLTLAFLVVVATLNDTLSAVSGVMLVQAGVVVTTGTFGLSFLWLTRDDGEDGVDA